MSRDDPPACLLCGGPTVLRYELPHISHQPKGSKSYRVCWCASCDFGALFPRPSPEELGVFYGDAYFSRYAGERTDEARRRTDRDLAAVSLLDRLRVHLAWRMDRGRGLDAGSVHAAAGWTPARVCDVGCGNGDLMLELRALGHEVVGVEVDEHARKRAAAKGLAVFPGTAEELPGEIRDQGYDVVTMTHVLEHCLDPIRALRNGAALLRPGGALMVEVPNNGSASARRAGAAWFHFDAGRHVNFFTAQSLTRAVEAAGCEVADLRFGGYVVAFSNDRIAVERRVWDALYADEATAPAGRVARGGRGAKWSILIRTLVSAPPRKYEMVAAVARRTS